MATSLQQTDAVASPCGAVAPCGTVTALSSAPNARMATAGGTAGSGTQNASVDSGQTEATVMFQSSPTDFNVASWPSGTWTVRLNVTGPNGNLTVTRIAICRVANGSCAAVATVANASQATVLTNAQVYTFNLTGVSTSGAADDLVYVVMSIRNAQFLVESLAYKADQLIDTPITAGPPLAPPTPPLPPSTQQGHTLTTPCPCCVTASPCACQNIKALLHASFFSGQCSCLTLVIVPITRQGPTSCTWSGSAAGCHGQVNATMTLTPTPPFGLLRARLCVSVDGNCPGAPAGHAACYSDNSTQCTFLLDQQCPRAVNVQCKPFHAHWTEFFLCNNFTDATGPRDCCGCGGPVHGIFTVVYADVTE